MIDPPLAERKRKKKTERERERERKEEERGKQRKESGKKEKPRWVEPRETAPSEVNRGSIVLRGLTGSCSPGDRETEKRREREPWRGRRAGRRRRQAAELNRIGPAWRWRVRRQFVQGYLFRKRSLRRPRRRGCNGGAGLNGGEGEGKGA